MRVGSKANEPSTGSEEFVLRMLVWGVLRQELIQLQ